MAVRKIKFDVRKKCGRSLSLQDDNAKGLVVSLLDPVSPPEDNDELLVKHPIAYFTSTKLSNTMELHGRIMHPGIKLPEGWLCSVVSSTNLALFKLAVTPPILSADFTFMLTIQYSGTWTLSVSRKEVDPKQCQLLESVPSQLL